MKKFLIYSLLLAVLFGNSGAGCSKTEADDVVPADKAFLRMKINGKTWTATTKISGVALKGIISFGGDLGKENFSVLINGSETPGTYTITQSTNGSTAAYSSDAGGSLNGAYFSTRAPGSILTVKVTRTNGLNVAGTFSGTLGLEAAFGTGTAGPTTVTITDGEFLTVD